MGSIHLGAIALLSESEGVFTTAQAERMGVPRDTLHDAVESGRLERIMRGAYRMIGSGSSYTDGLVAAWKLTAPARFAHEPAEVGDRPDRPHGHAEAVETRYGLAVLARQDDSRPRCVDDHEDDRQDHGHRVRGIRGTVPGDGRHNGRPRRVAREALVRGGCAGYPSNAA